MGIPVGSAAPEPGGEGTGPAAPAGRALSSALSVGILDLAREGNGGLGEA